MASVFHAGAKGSDIGSFLQAKAKGGTARGGEANRVRKGKVGKSKGGADGYHPGTVLRTWDEGNAYRIELEDGKRTNVWGPLDDDTIVKRRKKE